MTLSAVPWFGGKHKLARRIIELLPAHLVYVEAFGGAASVLLTKQPARLDVYNDLDSGLVTFFRVLRDQPEELIRRLELTPFAREEFDLCRQTWAEQEDDVERARRWFVRVEQAFAGTPNTTGWGGERLGRRHGSRARTSANHVIRLEAVARRLRRVQIEHLDWRDALERYDHEDTVFYLDPPYMRETRRRPRTRGGLDYAHELTAAEHEELVERVIGLHAAVLLSGYEHTSYQPLERAGFTRHKFEVLCSAAASRDDNRIFERTEIVWRRAPHADRLFT